MMTRYIGALAVDTKIFASLIIFLVAFLFIQAQFGTEYYKNVSGWTANYSANSTQVAISGNIQAPPTCEPVVASGNWAKDVIDSIFSGGSCMGDWVGWFLSLMYFNSSINWLNTLIILPVTVIIAYLLFRFARGI